MIFGGRDLDSRGRGLLGGGPGELDRDRGQGEGRGPPRVQSDRDEASGPASPTETLTFTAAEAVCARSRRCGGPSARSEPTRWSAECRSHRRQRRRWSCVQPLRSTAGGPSQTSHTRAADRHGVRETKCTPSSPSSTCTGAPAIATGGPAPHLAALSRCRCCRTGAEECRS